MDGNNDTHDCDVLVIGGGPGGSTAATLLAGRGWRVTMLERDRHPRFHIGESLLPANMPIFEEIGALEKLRAIGRLKLGADFPREDGSYYTFRFDRALGIRRITPSTCCARNWTRCCSSMRASMVWMRVKVPRSSGWNSMPRA